MFEWLGSPVASYLRDQGAPDPDGLASDVFLRVFTNLTTFEGSEDSFRSWVFAIAHNVLIDDRRKAGRRPMLARRPLDDRPWAGSTEGEALARLGTERVERLLEELSPDQLDVLLLRIVADLTVEQVAHTLGKPAGAVKQLQGRGLAALRRRLDANGVGRTLSDSPDVHRPR